MNYRMSSLLAFLDLYQDKPMNECLMTTQHKNTLSVGRQTMVFNKKLNTKYIYICIKNSQSCKTVEGCAQYNDHLF